MEGLTAEGDSGTAAPLVCVLEIAILVLLMKDCPKHTQTHKHTIISRKLAAFKMLAIRSCQPSPWALCIQEQLTMSPNQKKDYKFS